MLLLVVGIKFCGRPIDHNIFQSLSIVWSAIFFFFFRQRMPSLKRRFGALVDAGVERQIDIYRCTQPSYIFFAPLSTSESLRYIYSSFPLYVSLDVGKSIYQSGGKKKQT